MTVRSLFAPSSRSVHISIMEEELLSCLDLYEELYRAATRDGNVLHFYGQEHWRFHVEYASKLMDASRIALLASIDYTELLVAHMATVGTGRIRRQ